MMNLKTTALHLSRQGVSRQFIPISNPKNAVLSLTQRTAQSGNVSAANAPANPVRSFSSSQTTRDNNNNNSSKNSTGSITGAHQFQQQHPSVFTSHLNLNSFHSNNSGLPLTSKQFQSPLASNLHFRSESNSQQTRSSNTKHSQLSNNAWIALQDQDARAVFSSLQEMRHQGVYADAALSTRIVAQFLDMNSPLEAEKALSLLVDCHQSQGRTLSPSQRNIYTSLAKDIANYSSDFSQALSLAKLMDRHGLSTPTGFADDALRSYRQLKSSSGLDSIKKMLKSGDIDMLLNLQSSSVQASSSRYKHLIEILRDAKEMNIMPSQESCSRISVSFMNLNDYTGQLAWDTAVQEIYPGYKATIPEAAEAVHDNNATAAATNTNSLNSSNSRPNSQGRSTYTSGKQQRSQNIDPASEAIIRACRSGYASVAVEAVQKMIAENHIPSAQAIADTIQVCAKREKERTTDYKQLFSVAQKSLEAVQDPADRRAAQYDVYNAMLVANATLGDMTSAKENYDAIVRLGQFPDATGYATLLIATTTGAVDEALDALKILEEVRRHKIRPNLFFYNVVIGKLSRGRKIERVLEVYEEMVNQHKIRPNAITYGTLISACTRVGSEEMAKRLFQEMVSASSYHARHGPHNAMIQFYVRQKKDRVTALEYYEDMLERRLVPTEHTYTLLIEAFASIQPYDLAEANRLIQSLMTRNNNGNGPSVKISEAHFGTLIHAYGVDHRDLTQAEAVFETMVRQARIVPKGPAYQSLIESYIINQQIHRAVQVREELLRSGQSSTAYIENTMIRGFGQQGQVEDAEKIFEGMLDSSSSSSTSSKSMVVKEPSTYQSMVSVYLENNMVDKAFETLTKMKAQGYPDLVIRPVEDALQNHATPRIDELELATA
ncbi:hypothetical protein BGZ83_002183 [Gryganskiella cystojenkinii]|nr:hypothetical protein BGZ83_002183 [Gryganskiella cystojenkinii]